MDGRYGPAFADELLDLMRWRRDVRRFRPDPVEAAVLDRCLSAFALAPSVGLSEPWRLLRVDSPQARAAVLANFRAANADALARQSAERAGLYARLKLAGLAEAPVQIAAFCDETTAKGQGLGAATMPEVRAYSVVGAIQNLWLMARACGLGMGWVSILDPVRLAADLGTPDGWRFIGYLCLGHAEADSDTPELEREGWETRAPALSLETR